MHCVFHAGGHVWRLPYLQALNMLQRVAREFGFLGGRCNQASLMVLLPSL